MVVRPPGPSREFQVHAVAAAPLPDVERRLSSDPQRWLDTQLMHAAHEFAGLIPLGFVRVRTYAMVGGPVVRPDGVSRRLRLEFPDSLLRGVVAFADGDLVLEPVGAQRTAVIYVGVLAARDGLLTNTPLTRGLARLVLRAAVRRMARRLGTRRRESC